MTQSTPPSINEFIKAWADKRGISDVAAWNEFRIMAVPKTEIQNFIESQIKTTTIAPPSRIAELLAQKNDNSIEKLRIELEYKKLDREEKAEKLEQDKLNLEREKIASTERIAALKLEFEEKRQQSKDDFNQMMLLVQGGKKPEEALDMIKNQEKFYERLLDERLNHSEEMGNLKEDAEKKLRELKSEIESIKNHPNDIATRLKELKNTKDEFIGILDTLGFDKNQLATAKSSNEQGVWGRLISKAEPFINELMKQPQQASSGFSPSAQQQQQTISPEIEQRIRAETEAKAEQIREENEKLMKQLEEEKKNLQSWREERQKLESDANRLGVYFDNTISNEELFYTIEAQEAIAERSRERKSPNFNRDIQEPQQAFKTQPTPQTQPQLPIQESVISGMPQQDINTDIYTDFLKEIEKPRETSPETDEFMKSSEEKEAVVVKAIVSEKSSDQTTELKTEPERLEVITEVIPEKKKARSKSKNHHFTIVREDDNSSTKLESPSARGAALKISNLFGGTEDAPVKVKVIDEKGNEKKYDTFSKTKQIKSGKKVPFPRIKSVD